MAEEIPVTVVLQLPRAEAAPRPELPEPAAVEPSPDEARAIETVFAQQQENRLVAGLLGLWSGALVMHDLAIETFRKAADEEEDGPEPRKKKKEPPAGPTP